MALLSVGTCAGCDSGEHPLALGLCPDCWQVVFRGAVMAELSVGVCETCHREAPLVNGLCAACRPVDAPVIDPRTLPGDEARLLYLTVRHSANERHPVVGCPEGMDARRYDAIVAGWLGAGWACRYNTLPVLTIAGRLAARQVTQADLHQKGACLPGCELCPRPGKGG